MLKSNLFLILVSALPVLATDNYGDAFIASAIGEASYLNPILAQDSASAQINSLVYNGLTKYDKNLRLVGDLAEKWEIRNSGKTIRFYLRKNVFWHDGKKFTASDVLFTYKKLVDPNIRTPYRSDYTIIKNIRVINPYVIEINYQKPFAPALESWGIGILPEHIFRDGDFNNHPANRKPVGTGPFQFVSWKTDDKIILRANRSYFANPVLISRYIQRVIPDQSVLFLEMRSQAVDEINLTPDQWQAYPQIFSHYRKFHYPSFSYTYLAFNLLHPLYRQKKFRQAIAHAINKSEIIQGALLGQGQPASGPFPPQSWAYNPKVVDYPYDPEKAKKLLAELGYTAKNKDGYLVKNGEVLEFTLLTNLGNKTREITAQIIQSQLKKVGIKVNIRVLEWATFINQFVNKRNFEAIILGWSLSRDPDQYIIWHSSQRGPGQYNIIGYQNPEVDKLLEIGRHTFDFNRRKKVYQRLHKILADDLPYIFLYYPETLLAIHKRFVGPEVAPAGVGWNFPEWYVPKKLQRYHYAD